MTIAQKKEIGEGQSLYVVKILENNYSYAISWDNKALIVDPGEADPLFALLEQEGLQLINILVTHYHDDHTGGIQSLCKKAECHVIGPDDERVPCLEQSVDEGEELLFGPFEIEVFATPGHTRPHVVYFFRDLHLLFSGDLLFAGGCGKVMEGTPQEMYESLQKIVALPDNTNIYCGHEYTQKNLEFALSLEPNNEKVKARLERVQALFQEDRPTVPSNLAEEKATNPFLRTHTSELQKALGIDDPIALFSHLRELKNKF